MSRKKTKFQSSSFTLLITALAILVSSGAVNAYVDLAPTLARITSDSESIAMVQVKEYDAKTRTVTFEAISALKGPLNSKPVQHALVSPKGSVASRQILQWATPGSQAIVFTSSSRVMANVCIGEGWYEADFLGGSWKLGKERPDLPLAYYGKLSRLNDAVKLMLAGKDAVITVVAFGADNEGASFDLALNRQDLPGLVRVQRIRANLQMPSTVASASANPQYFLGGGAVDSSEIPELLQRLESPDALTRAESAEDLRTLGRKAASAAPALAKLLNDESPRVRFAAASALLRVAPTDQRGIDVLSAGLGSSDLSLRRDAARATGFAGAGAAPLAGRLAALLKDSDQPTQIIILQSISLLGRAGSDAVPAITPLLDDPELRVDAADALGRIGPAARPALKKIAPMLTAPEPTTQWAAVRAMSQIGGPDAHPAVEYMIKALPKATEVEGYNMMIYLSLLGPVASDAIPTIQNTAIKNPVLPSAAQWAISSQNTLPWQMNTGRGGGRGGRGFGGGGPGGFGGGGGDIFSFVYQAYVRELGDRLRPTAKLLAQKIMDGSAGQIPAWGYEILNCGPDESIAIFTPHLSDNDLQTRERATVALGFMGATAADAKPHLQSALGKASTESEQRLIKWAIKKVSAG